MHKEMVMDLIMNKIYYDIWTKKFLQENVIKNITKYTEEKKRNGINSFYTIWKRM